MKRLHRSDLYMWSSFDHERNIDFNSVLWVRPEGNVLIDPLEMIDHDRTHLDALGGAAHIVVTNSDHLRGSHALRDTLSASLIGPQAEKDGFPVSCDRWVGDGDWIVPGLLAIEMDGSKTPGELALVLEKSTLITGDLVRAHCAGTLMMLPDAKLADRARAVDSVRRLLEHDRIETVLVGDGWSLFSDARRQLESLVVSTTARARPDITRVEP